VKEEKSGGVAAEEEYDCVDDMVGLPARERFINCRHSSSVLFCCF